MESALKRYYDHFGENYPLLITSTKTDDEIIKEIDLCIKTNEKAGEPVFDDDSDY